MSDVLAIDIETENFSHEIGGWGNTHMFSPTVVATWTGDGGTVYCNKSQAGEFLPEGVKLKALSPKFSAGTLKSTLPKAVGSWDTTSSALTYLC